MLGAVDAPISSSSTLGWMLVVYCTLACVIWTVKPRYLFDDSGRFRALGVSDREKSSIFAAPMVMAVVAIVSAFVPLMMIIVDDPSVHVRGSSNLFTIADQGVPVHSALAPSRWHVPSGF